MSLSLMLQQKSFFLMLSSWAVSCWWLTGWASCWWFSEWASCWWFSRWASCWWVYPPSRGGGPPPPGIWWGSRWPSQPRTCSSGICNHTHRYTLFRALQYTGGNKIILVRIPLTSLKKDLKNFLQNYSSRWFISLNNFQLFSFNLPKFPCISFLLIFLFFMSLRSYSGGDDP